MNGLFVIVPEITITLGKSLPWASKIYPDGIRISSIFFYCMNRSSIPTHPVSFEGERAATTKDMKLSDAPSEEARARLRASNLDDLENAFKDESPLSESYDEMFHVPVPPPQASLYNQDLPKSSYRDDNLEAFLMPPKVSQPNYREDDLESFLCPEQKGAPEEREIEVKPILRNTEEAKGETEEENSEGDKDEEIVAKNEMNQDKKAPDQNKEVSPMREKPQVKFSQHDHFDTNEDDESEYDPFNFDGKKEERLSSIYRSTERQQSRPVLVINGAELNSPKRKTCLATLLIVCAALGFGFAMSQPPKIAALTNSSQNPGPCEANAITVIRPDVNPTPTTIKCTPPTISPAPSNSYLPTQMPSLSKRPSFAPIAPNIYDFTYRKIQKFLVDSQISNVTVLPAQCYHTLCGRGVRPEKLTIQQKVVNHLMTGDSMFYQWVAEDKLYDHAERVIQRYVLTLMGFSLGSNNWENRTNWPIENGLVASNSECEWFGLTCADRSAYKHLKDFVDHTFLAKGSISGREVEVSPMVTKIVLRQNMLNGELPQELFKLRHLEELKIHNNKISGTLPKSIGLLSNIRKFWIHNTTDLTGTIPTTIGNMTRLTSLWIGLNKIEGSIPKEIGNLENLHTLGLLANKIEGTIPKEIVKLKNMKNLYLDMNQLNGTLPDLIGQMSELKDLRIDNNQLSGTLPFSLSDLKKLETFYAYKNRLTGDIGNNFVVGWESLGKHPFLFYAAF